MKKVLAFSLMILMVFSMSLAVYAAPGEFVQSPSKNKAPALVDFSSESADCLAKIIITPFKDRDNLSKQSKDLIEKAYKDIANSKNLVDLCSDLSDVAKKMNVPESNLAVSDLFDVDYSGCDVHDNHGKFDITIESETFENFAALMYYTENGWKMVENAEVKKVNGEYHLVFTTGEFGPFAVVVNSSVVVDEDIDTGDNNSVYFYAVMMVASAFVAVLMLKKGKKQTV